MKKRILIASGGTGGHFYPGYALGRELSSRGWEILFLVRKNEMSRDDSFPTAEVDIVGFPRGFLTHPLSGIIFFKKLVPAYFYVRRILLDWQPASVVGMGGHVSFPAVLAARMLNIPSMIHEANAKLGLSNRLCSMFASRMALGLPIEGLSSAGNIRLTGTPIRDYFRPPCNSSLSRKNMDLNPLSKTVLVFGGSQGARNLNLSMVKVAKRIVSAGSGSSATSDSSGTEQSAKQSRAVTGPSPAPPSTAIPVGEHTMRGVGAGAPDSPKAEGSPASADSLRTGSPSPKAEGNLQFLHITGSRDYRMVLDAYKEAGLSSATVKVLEYSDEMNKVYAAADIAVCRSGASTIAELIHLEKPAILVPFPSSAGGHQNDNAQILKACGAAIVVRESPALSDDLCRALGQILSGNLLQDMKRSYERLDVPNPIAAASRLADYVEQL